MSLNHDIVGHYTTAETPWTWTERDTLLYALSIGAGERGGEAELAFTTENARGIPQQVIPTFATVMGMGHGDTDLSRYGDFDLTQLLHAGQSVRVHAPIPASGSASVTRGVSAFYDKGKNAIMELVTRFTDAATDAPLVETTMQAMIRGEGGFGGEGGPRDEWTAPEQPADQVVISTTQANQALLYRLNGDRNPLHCDPSFAQQVGFPHPILHGLCTFGFASRALLSTIAGGDAARFGEFSGRFSSPVFPGEQLETRIWATADGARFQTLAADRVVLDRGSFTLR